MLEYNYVLDYKNYKIYVKIKRIKNMYLRIKVINNQAYLYVTASKYIPKSQVLKFIENNENWIVKNILKTNEKIRQKQQLKDKNEVLFFGKPYILEVENSNKNAVQIIENKIIVKTKDIQNADLIYKIWSKIQLHNYLSKYVLYWSNQMQLYPSSFYIRDMKTRWGSCNIKTNRICFALRLIEKEASQIDYVIIHELAHIKYPDHQRQFKSLLTKYCPNWTNIRKSLKT